MHSLAVWLSSQEHLSMLLLETGASLRSLGAWGIAILVLAVVELRVRELEMMQKGNHVTAKMRRQFRCRRL